MDYGIGKSQLELIIMTDKIVCANCDGEGCVCENHPEVPWLEGDGCCGGAGMLCICHPRYDETND